MSILDKLFGRAEAPKKRSRAVSESGSHPSSQSRPGPYYEALSKDNSRQDLPFGATSLTPLINSMHRQQLAGIARWLYDNHPLVGYAVDLFKIYSTPIYPQSLVEEIGIQNAYEQYFEDWARRAEFTGRFSFSQCLEMASLALDTDGDTGFLGTRENGFFQVQLVDSSIIASEVDNRFSTQKDATPEYIDGVRVDGKGRVLGYSVAKRKRGEFEIFPQGRFLLVYEPDRLTRYRGFSPLRRGANDMRDGNEIKQFLKLGVKYDSAIMSVLENEFGEEEEDEWGDDENNQPADDASAHEKKIGLADLLGGEIPILPKNTKLRQLTSTRPERNVIDFVNLLAGHMVNGLGLPAAFLLDDRLTGPNQRAVNGKAQRRFEKRQETISEIVRWAWIRVIGDAIDRRELPAAKNWFRCSFQTPPKISIDSGREMAQEREDVGKLLMTRREHFGNRGRDWMKETKQGFAEIDYIASEAKQIADRYGLNMETVFNSIVASKTAKSEGKEKKETDE